MYMGVSVCVCMCGVRVWAHVRLYYGCVLIPLPLCVFDGVLHHYKPVWGDQDLLQEIRIGVRYGLDTLAIQKLTHRMIRRFVPIRAVKTR